MPKATPLLLIIGWSLLVHLPGLTSPLLDYHAFRQCQTASMSRNFVRHDMKFFEPQLDHYGPPVRVGTEFPIYSYIVALLYKVFGVQETLGRLLSIALTAWSAVFLFWFIRRRLGEPTALWTALVMCAIPIHVYFTRTFQPEPMAMWGLLGFLCYFDRWVRDGRWVDALLATALGAIGPLLKLPYLYLVGGLWLVFAWESGFFARRARVTAFGVIVLIVSLTAVWYAWAKSAPVQVLPMGLDYHLQNLAPVLTLKFWTHHFVSRFPELLTTYSGLVLGLYGFFVLRKLPTPPSPLFFFAGWWFVTFLYTLLCGAYGITHKYTSLPWAPVNAVWIAAGIVSLSLSRKVWVKGLLVILMVGIPIHSAIRIKHWYRVEREYLFDARQEIERLSSPGDLVFTNTDEHPVLLYYIDRYGFAGRIDSMSFDQMTTALNQNVRYMLTPVDELWRSRPDWAAYFGRRGRLVHADTEYLIYEIL